MDHSTSVLTPLIESESLASRLANRAVAAPKNYFAAFPIRLRDDLLYLWATFRLRYRPIKIIFLLAALGVICAFWEYLGYRYASAKLQSVISAIRQPFILSVLSHTAQAMFSSLNILSCISVPIMARTLRHLLKQGHIEMIQLVPGRFRPSALFYATSMRYVPLSFIALLVIYLEKSPRVNPYLNYPFVRTGQISELPDQWPIFWAALHQLAVMLFCVTNLYMDMAIGFWLFNRFRVSYPTVMIAVLVIGLIEPIILMAVHDFVQNSVSDALGRQVGIFRQIAQTIRPGPNSYLTVADVFQTVHYFGTGVLSGIVGWLLLGNLNDRWAKLESSKTKDPVLMKPVG